MGQVGTQIQSAIEKSIAWLDAEEMDGFGQYQISRVEIDFQVGSDIVAGLRHQDPASISKFSVRSEYIVLAFSFSDKATGAPMFTVRKFVDRDSGSLVE
jgi:hypothetical protein